MGANREPGRAILIKALFVPKFRKGVSQMERLTRDNKPRKTSSDDAKLGIGYFDTDTH